MINIYKGELMKKSFLLKPLSILLALVFVFSVFSIPVFADEENESESESVAETEKEDDVLSYRPVYVTTSIKDEVLLNAEEEIKSGNNGGLFDFAPSVEPLSGLKVTDNTKNSVSLTWDKIESISGYNIYYRKHDSGAYYYIYSTLSNEVTISNLEHCTAYDFMICAYIETNNVKYEGTPQETTAFTLPNNVGTISILRSSDVIAFEWLKSENATGYQIYKCDFPGDDYELYETIDDFKETEYEDDDVSKGDCYSYKVRAYFDYDGETYYSKFSDFYAMAGLYAAEIDTVTTQVRRVSFTYEDSPLSEAFEIFYAKNDPNNHYESLGETAKLYFNSPRLTAGTNYYFRVIPYKTVGGRRIYGTYKTVEKICSDKAYAVDVGDTYIEVSLRQQHMWQYVDGELTVESDVVSGNVGARATPKGCYKVLQRSSPATLVGDDYRTKVNYWLGFTYSGCGLHDATWRGSFGGNIYTYDGSHGCVNMPIDKVKEVYGYASTGDYVVIY